MKLTSVAPMAMRGGPNHRNICFKCKIAWWSRTRMEKCDKCGTPFVDRDAWKGKPFTPDRLTAAREVRGVELDNLARRLNMPIADFESGAIVPTHAQIMQFASVLGFPPAFMTLPPPEPESGPLFLCRDPEFCYVCIAPAYHLCDFVKAGGKTCDRPICEDHGACVGKSDDGDTIDHCDFHRGIKHRDIAEPPLHWTPSYRRDRPDRG